MNHPVFRIVGERRGSDTAEPSRVTATIFAPKQTGHGDFACLVSIPGLVDENKLILGVDENHAIEVSAFFVRSLLHGMQIDIRQEEAVSNGS